MHGGCALHEQYAELRALRHPEVLAETRGPARAWLFTVARRIVIDEWRSGRARHEVVAATPPGPRLDRCAAGHLAG